MNTLLEEDFYYNEKGYIVLTSVYHSKKGYCCGNGCLHCPYNYINVEECKRKILLTERPPIIYPKKIV